MILKKSVIDSIGGKLFVNYSNVMTKIPPETITKLGNNMNKQISKIIEKYGEKYKNNQVCYEIDVSKIGMAWRLPIKRFIFYNYYAQSSKDNLNNALESFVKYYENI